MALAGKVAIVTGGSRGIGAGIALKLAQEGAKVAITYVSSNSASKANALVDQIRELGSMGAAIQADLSDPAAPARLIKEVLSNLETTYIDILVNNAGVAVVAPIEQVTLEDYESQFAVNTRAVFFMTQAVLPYIRQGGRIINVSSTNARTGMPATSVYSASKVAIEGFTRVHAAELGQKYGITVNAINPGPVETDMYLSSGEDVHKMMAELVKNIPAGGRMAKPDDIADIVAFIASDAARWISGNVITANGGLVMM